MRADRSRRDLDRGSSRPNLRNSASPAGESGIVLAAVLMVLAALSLLAASGKGNTALQWVQIRNARDYDEAARLAEAGLSQALAAGSFRLGGGDAGRYCRTRSQCVDWTVRHVETTPVPQGLTHGLEPSRALHFEIAAEAAVGRAARAGAVLGFLVIAPGEPNAPLPGAIRICGGGNNCPEDSAEPPIRRYWREAAE